jgi:hypothetical protein
MPAPLRIAPTEVSPRSFDRPEDPGSGHLPTLQFFANASPEYNLVDVRQYIGAY